METYDNDFITELISRFKSGTPIADIIKILENQMSFYSHRFIVSLDQEDRTKYFVINKYVKLLSQEDE